MENLLDSSSALQKRRRRIEKETKPSLSNNESFILDDIIIEILSWLAAKDVLRSRCVCRRWRNLTSTRDFTDLHNRRSFPMILKDYRIFMDYNRGGRDLLDGCWEPAQTRSKIHKVYEPCETFPELSHNGLIVSTIGNTNSVKIYNPIYHDVVDITVPIGTSRGVYGVFFHPVVKEYCTLWRITLSLKPLKVQYRILNLESNPHWRDIKNPCNQNAMIRSISSILIDEYLYWMVDSSDNFRQSHNNTFNCGIMEYDIRNEEFRVIPCPVPVNLNLCSYNVNLVDIDGVVSLVQVFPSEELVEIIILTLKDHGEQLWTSSQFIVTSDIDLCRGYGVPKAFAFWNGELVLQKDGELYVCNLKLGTFRKFGGRWNDNFANQLLALANFFSHATSLVSLRNCNSKICIVEEDVENQ